MPPCYLAEPVPTRRAEWLRSLVFSLLNDSVVICQRFVASRGWVMRSFSAERGDVVCGILDSSQVGTLQASVVGWGGRWDVQGRFPHVIFLNRLLLGFASEVGLESILSVGVDGLFSEVVRSAASYRKIN